MGTRTSYEPGTFSWVDLQTSDQEGAKAFYSGLFGWETDDRPAGEGVTYTMCSLGGENVAGIGPLMADQIEQGIPPHWNNYVTVASADEIAERAPELGGHVLAPPFDVLDAGRMAVIADPVMAPLCVWEPRGSIGAERVNDPGCMTYNELATTDTAKAQMFYSALFGWRFEAEDTQGGPPYWTIRHDGARSGLNGGMRELAPEQVEGGIPPHWMPYFTAEEMESALERVKELGGGSQFGPIAVGPESRFAVASDPQGGFFALFEGTIDD